MIILGEVPQFKNLTQSAVKFFCYMSTFKVYQNGDEVSLPYGGIVLKGNLNQVAPLKQGLADWVQVILKKDVEGDGTPWIAKSPTYVVVMEFNEVVEFTDEPLTEEYVNTKYKEAQSIKFK